MIEFVDVKKELIIPTSEDVMQHQGIPKGTIIKDHISAIFEDTRELFIAEAEPLCMMMEITKNDFEIIYNGEGNNEEDDPIKSIFQNADNLALYAFTLGEKISKRISGLFNDKDFAVASMLDSVASVSVDKAVELLESYFLQILKDKKLAKNRSMVFGYSPGYCGWNISAQKKLFEYFHPEKIGITLNDSYLMTPIKSVTGVLIHGDKTIHDFSNSFSFCLNCKTQSCLDRIEKIYKS